GIDLEGLRESGDGGGQFAPFLVLVPVLQREPRACLLRLELELRELLGDLRTARIELLGGLQRGDRARPLAVLRHGDGVLVQLARGGDARESLAAQEPLAAFAVAALFFLARKLAALDRGAVVRAQLRGGLLVVLSAQILVAEHLVRRREPLERLRQERSVVAQVLSVPGVRMVAARPLEVRAPDGTRVGVGADAEHLVMRQAARALVEIGELLAELLGKVRSPSTSILQHASHG